MHCFFCSENSYQTNMKWATVLFSSSFIDILSYKFSILYLLIYILPNEISWINTKLFASCPYFSKSKHLRTSTFDYCSEISKRLRGIQFKNLFSLFCSKSEILISLRWDFSEFYFSVISFYYWRIRSILKRRMYLIWYLLNTLLDVSVI